MQDADQKPVTEALARSQAIAIRLLQGDYGRRDAMIWFQAAIWSYIRLFGNDSSAYRRLIDFRPRLLQKQCSTEELKARISEVGAIAEALQEIGQEKRHVGVSRPSRVPDTRRVFIVHGHDELNARRLSDILGDRAHNLEPAVMMEEPGKGRTLIKKFEDEAETCAFAFALYSPDDKVTAGATVYFQARPQCTFRDWMVCRAPRA